MAKQWSIEKAGDSSVLVTDNVTVADYPIIYHNGDIGYNFPELIPEYVKREVHVYLNAMKEKKVYL